MSQRSFLISQLGSSFRSDQDVEEADLDRGHRGRPLEEADLDRGPRGRPLDELLALLPPGDRSLDNLSDTSGDQSVVSHPFSEDTPRFAGTGKDRQFSSTYQEVMNELKKEDQEKAASVCSTCSSCESCSTDIWDALGIDEAKIARVTPRPLPLEVERELSDKLSEFCIEKPQRRRHRSPAPASGVDPRELAVRSPGGDSALSRKSPSHRTPGGSKRPQSKARELDAMSGLWNMLATYDEFVVTPPGFNLYQQEKPHWLDQEPIPWEEREKARRICVKWLRHYHM